MKNNGRKNVAVVFGGRSVEHDVSIITGVLCLNCIDRTKYNPVPVYVTEDGWFSGENMFDVSNFKSFNKERSTRVALTSQDDVLYRIKGEKLKPVCRLHCIINCCHGLNGEDGTVAALAQLSRIPFASPSVMASSVCMDKAATKAYLQGLGVNVLPYKVITKGAYFQNRSLAITLCEHAVGYPCIVKPARLGSSIGIKRATGGEGLKEAIEYALRFDSKILVERAAENFKEVNCAAYKKGGRIIISQTESPSVRAGDILSFADKYSSKYSGGEREFPAVLPEKIEEKIKNTTSLCYRKLFCTGVVRIDYIVEGTEVYLNEINTVPGSLALYLFKDSVAEYGEVLTELIEEGERAFREFEGGTFTYKSNVLSGIPNKMSGSKRSTN